MKHLLDDKGISLEMLHQSLETLKVLGFIEYNFEPGTNVDSLTLTLKLSDGVIAIPETMH